MIKKYFKNRILLPVIGLVALIAAAAHASNQGEPPNRVPAVQLNNQALSALKNKDLDGAESTLIKALGVDPFNPILHLNLGWVFEAEKKYDMAIREYQSILQPGQPPVPDQLKFIANFNSGNAAAEKKQPDIDSALRYYQAALDVQPDSKETKTNIELLFQGGKGKGQGGGGQGQNKDNSNEGKNKPPGPKDNFTNKGHPKPQFNSKDLTQEDVRKIMNEIKSEEQKIRAKEYGSQQKDRPPEKDW